MQCVDAIWQDLIERLPLHGKGVAIEPEDMIWVNLPYGGLDSVIKCWQPHVLGIARLV